VGCGDTLKVYLYYPWKFPDASYYKYLLDYPPPKIEFITSQQKYGVLQSPIKFKLLNFVKKSVRNTFDFCNFSIPNMHSCNVKNVDLIQGAHCLIKTDLPWVADVEADWNLWLGNTRPQIFKKVISKVVLQDNCKFLLPWTNYTLTQILDCFPEFENKLEVIYPAVPYFSDFKKSKCEKIRLLFVSRYFFMKGGAYVFEVFKRLKKDYPNLELNVVSDVPQEIKKKYSLVDGIRYWGIVSQDVLFKDVYPNSDIFFYPSFVDTFGLGLLEAMSFGLPIVTVSNPTRGEIISDGKTGFIVKVDREIDYDDYLNLDEQLVSELCNRISKLIDSKTIFKKMSDNCKLEVKAGKFSIKERNKKLKKIYSESVSTV
jgi:glycosyltransferase involved in cell wall biosynthesis